MKLHLVQILVVVANIQVKFLKTEVEKGFMRTAIGHELVDPKEKTNLEKWNYVPTEIQTNFTIRKGISLILLD